MTVYTVHAPMKADGVAVDPGELVFVKEGFSWPALLIPPVWLIYRRLWLALLIWLVAVIVLGALAGFAGTDASTVVLVLFAFWFALEANGFRRWTLERRRHALVGVVEGRTLEEAERRFFGEPWLADERRGIASTVAGGRHPRHARAPSRAEAPATGGRTGDSWPLPLAREPAGDHRPHRLWSRQSPLRRRRPSSA